MKGKNCMNIRNDKMNMYVNYCNSEENDDIDNSTIRILLCKRIDELSREVLIKKDYHMILRILPKL